MGGLDPGGGAGIAADLRAFAAAGAFGCAAVAVLTAQSTAGLLRAWPVPARQLGAQVRAVLSNQHIGAVKVGALGSRENVVAVARALALRREIPVVIDTPLRATRGRAHLLEAGALRSLERQLLPRATLLTVNASEAQALLGVPVRSSPHARDAARALLGLGPRAALIKGGHFNGPSATDVLALGDQVIEFRARRLPGPSVHGTGCTFASLIAGRLALSSRLRIDDRSLVAAIRWAKAVHHEAISRALRVGKGQRVLVFGKQRPMKAQVV